jgi:hypothetical protein
MEEEKRAKRVSLFFPFSFFFFPFSSPSNALKKKQKDE